VDPLDGTRELLEHVPPWTVSIGLAEDGAAVAGGVYDPTTGELFLGARETGTTLDGEPVRVSTRDSLEGALVLSNRWALRKRPAELTNQVFRASSGSCAGCRARAGSQSSSSPERLRSRRSGSPGGSGAISSRVT